MSDTTPTDAAGAARSEALDWLVGRLRWERILKDLHDQAEGAAPVAPVVQLAEPRPADGEAA